MYVVKLLHINETTNKKVHIKDKDIHAIQLSFRNGKLHILTALKNHLF